MTTQLVIDQDRSIITIELDPELEYVHEDYWECGCNEDFIHKHIHDNEPIRGTENYCHKCRAINAENNRPAKLIDIIQYLFNTKETK